MVFLLFAVMRRKPRTWWFYAWLGTIPLASFLIFITPIYIDPLFNKFEPLQEKHPQLVESIVTLTYAAGYPIPRSHMFLMQASAKTNTINAYVTGLGSSKRIVVWDTSIRKTSPDELLFIISHEMGHYVLNHVVKGFAFSRVTLPRVVSRLPSAGLADRLLGRRLGNSRTIRLGRSRCAAANF